MSLRILQRRDDWLEVTTKTGCRAFVPQKTGFQSDVWRPLIYTECCASIAHSSAPCYAAEESNLALGEEWAYPKYKIRIPGTVDPISRKVASLLWKFPFKDQDWMTVIDVRGRNFVYWNTSYAGSPGFDTWEPWGCMRSTWKSASFPQVDAPVDAPVHDCLALLGSPYSGSFQHFLDRSSIMYIQAEHVIRQCEVRLAKHPRHDAVAQLWKLFDPEALEKIREPSGTMYAKQLIIPCYTTPYQPYSILKTREVWMSKAGVSHDVPLERRKKVILLRRSGDSFALNGRNILNSLELEQGVREFLDDRGQDEVLEVWNSSTPIIDTMKVWAQEVRAVIGMHGGAIYNQRFLAKDSLVLEIWPTNKDLNWTRTDPMNFFHARTLDLQYWMVAEPIVDEKHNLYVNVSNVIEVLRRGLGRTDLLGPGLVPLEDVDAMIG